VDWPDARGEQTKMITNSHINERGWNVRIAEMILLNIVNMIQK
jgi:hypothetical protein